MRCPVSRRPTKRRSVDRCSNVRTARRVPAAARSSGGAVLTPTPAEHPCRSPDCPATRGCLPGEGLSFLPRPIPLQIRLTSLRLVSVSASMQRLVLARPVRHRASPRLAAGISHGAAGPTPCNIGSSYAKLTMPSRTPVPAPFITIPPGKSPGHQDEASPNEDDGLATCCSRQLICKRCKRNNSPGHDHRRGDAVQKRRGELRPLVLNLAHRSSPSSSSVGTFSTGNSWLSRSIG